MIEKILQYAVSCVVDFSRVRLPYWMVFEVNHIRLFTLFASLFLLLVGLTTFSDFALEYKDIQASSKLAASATLVIGGAMALAFFVHNFCPSPANGNPPPEKTFSLLILDLATLIVTLTFFSLIMHEALTGLGIMQLIDLDFLDGTFLEDFLVLLDPFVKGLISVSLVVLLMLLKHKLVDRRQNAAMWSTALTFKSLRYLSVGLVFGCAIVVAVISEKLW
jgi:hypothetical protein